MCARKATWNVPTSAVVLGDLRTQHRKYLSSPGTVLAVRVLVWNKTGGKKLFLWRDDTSGVRAVLFALGPISRCSLSSAPKPANKRRSSLSEQGVRVPCLGRKARFEL